jgi:hypothetical protein
MHVNRFVTLLLTGNEKIDTIDAIDGWHFQRQPQENIMKADLNNEQNTAQIVTEAKVAYEPPTLTVMGKVEHLTALLSHGTPDLVSHGNII